MIALVAALVLLVASVVFAGFAYANRDGKTPTASISSLEPSEDRPSPAPSSSDTPSPEWDPDSFEIPEGYLGVASLGALTREPGSPFEPYQGPEASNALAVDMHAHAYSITETWTAYFAVGKFDSSLVPYNADDLAGTAEAAVEAWADSSAFGGVTGLETDHVATDKTTIDGRPGVLTSSLFSWESSEYTTDTFESVFLLLVDVDGEGWVGFASVPESAQDHLGLATQALVNTTFAY